MSLKQIRARFEAMSQAQRLGCGHVARKAGELNGVSLCDRCADRFAEETAYRKGKELEK